MKARDVMVTAGSAQSASEGEPRRQGTRSRGDDYSYSYGYGSAGRGRRGRRVVTACVIALSVAAVSASTSFAASSAGEAGSPRGVAAGSAAVRLPRPSGTYQVGEVDLHLVDRGRADPIEPAQGARQLMVSVVYPARAVAGYPLKPYMTSAVSAGFDQLAAVFNYGMAPGTTFDWSSLSTYEHLGAPVAAGRYPVVLYSPGAADIRSWDTVLVDQLASEGYVVVTIDPTYEASAVQFPQSVAESDVLDLLNEVPSQMSESQLLKLLVDTRVADTEFVLDSLDRLAAGTNPDAERRALPRGLGAAMDMRNVGMFGQSAGGFTALETMYEDPRIKAGVNMDGTLEYNGDPSDTNFSPVAQHGLNRPFLLLGSDSSEACTAATDPSCASILAHSTGLHAALTLPGTEHGSFTDAEVIMPQLAAQLPDGSLSSDIGSADPREVMGEEEALIAGFFDGTLGRS